MMGNQSWKGWVPFLVACTVCLALYGCDSPCEQLLEKVCEEWEDPQKCAEWREIAAQAGEDSCRESLKKLEDRQR